MTWEWGKVSPMNTCPWNTQIHNLKVADDEISRWHGAKIGVKVKARVRLAKHNYQRRRHHQGCSLAPFSKPLGLKGLSATRSGPSDPYEKEILCLTTAVLNVGLSLANSSQRHSGCGDNQWSIGNLKAIAIQCFLQTSKPGTVFSNLLNGGVIYKLCKMHFGGRFQGLVSLQPFHRKR